MSSVEVDRLKVPEHARPELAGAGMSTQPIVLGSWVVHPEHGFSQVWDVFDPEARQEGEEKFDDDVVLIANGTALRYVRLASLTLAEMGEEAVAS